MPTCGSAQSPAKRNKPSFQWRRLGFPESPQLVLYLPYIVLLTRIFQLKKIINGDFNKNPTGGRVFLREEVLNMKQLGYYYVSLYCNNA
jgi:hypothetical protein